jgi:hypothetical protein
VARIFAAHGCICDVRSGKLIEVADAIEVGKPD